MKRRTKNDLGMPMDGQPTLIDVEALDTGSVLAEPVKRRKPARTVKPWQPYIGGKIGCSDCIVESVYTVRGVTPATWHRRGRYGDEYICDQHHEKEAA